MYDRQKMQQAAMADPQGTEELRLQIKGGGVAFLSVEHQPEKSRFVWRYAGTIIPAGLAETLISGYEIKPRADQK